MLMVNQKVNTPLGPGVVQGPFGVLDGNGDAIVRGVLVRLPINEQTEKARKQSNCVTPAATVSGLWVFQESQLT